MENTMVRLSLGLLLLLGAGCAGTETRTDADDAVAASKPMFMSAEHVALANDRLAVADSVRAECAKLDRDYRVAYALADGPGGETAHWQMGFDRGGTAWLALGEPAQAADIVIRGDFKTMVRASKAAREGRTEPNPITMEGDPAVLQRVAPALAAARSAATVDVTFPEF